MNIRSLIRNSRSSSLRLIMFTGAPVRADQQVVVAFANGMTMKTSNSVANVDVRAQSFGPGACAVEFSGGGSKIGILAPPF